MPDRLTAQLQSALHPSLCKSHATYCRIVDRIRAGALTRAEDPRTHFSTYFLPYNPNTHAVFIVHHKKSGLWLTPGGHIEPGEDLLATLNREIDEELGMPTSFATLPAPFLFCITAITNPNQTCRAHYDVWFLLETQGKAFRIDLQEFHEVRWASFEEARTLMTDSNNLRALSLIERRYTE